jgi:hypothetical protein
MGGKTMTKLYYRRVFGKFECVKIEGKSKDVRLIFDEPINAKICISKVCVEIRDGEGEISLSDFESGIYEPRLILKTSSEKIGKFVLTSEGVSHAEPDYVREVFSRLEILSNDIALLKLENREIKDKIYGTKIF